MNYDFDMITILPLAAQRKARDTGQEGGPSGQRIALFRDRRVVEALQSADPAVQDLFLEAGFGLASWSSDVPEGSYRASEEEARQALLAKFNAALRASGGRLRAKNWGGFSIAGFTDGILSATSMTERELRDARYLGCEPGESAAQAEGEDATGPDALPAAGHDVLTFGAQVERQVSSWSGMDQPWPAQGARSAWAERPAMRRSMGQRALAFAMVAVTSVMGVAVWQLLGTGGDVELAAEATRQLQDF